MPRVLPLDPRDRQLAHSRSYSFPPQGRGILEGGARLLTHCVFVPLHMSVHVLIHHGGFPRWNLQEERRGKELAQKVIACP